VQFRIAQGLQRDSGARATVEAGFTTVRDVGARTYRTQRIVLMFRCAMRLRKVLCRTAHVRATYGIGATGGHFDDAAGFATGFSDRTGTLTDGSLMGRMRCAKQFVFEVRNGADVIKAAGLGLCFL